VQPSPLFEDPENQVLLRQAMILGQLIPLSNRN